MKDPGLELPIEFMEWVSIISDVFAFEDEEDAFAASNALAFRFLDAGLTFRKMTQAERTKWNIMQKGLAVTRIPNRPN